MYIKDESFEIMPNNPAEPERRATASLGAEVVFGTGEIIADGTKVIANRIGEASDASDATDVAIAAGAVGIGESIADSAASISEIAAEGTLETVTAGLEVVASEAGTILSGVGEAIGGIIGGIFDAI